jgi:hypothetical protein
MDDRRTPIDPGEAARRFAKMLAEAGLPCFTSSFNAPGTAHLRLGWDNGFRLHIDLTRDDWDAIDGWEREAILAEPIDVSVAGAAEDPRTQTSIRGVVIHRGPPLHPDDVTTHLGLPVTSPSRTLIDCAEYMTAAELGAAFARARDLGLLDPDALRAARARVEWRPSLAMLDEAIDEFCT